MYVSILTFFSFYFTHVILKPFWYIYIYIYILRPTLIAAICHVRITPYFMYVRVCFIKYTVSILDLLRCITSLLYWLLRLTGTVQFWHHRNHD